MIPQSIAETLNLKYSGSFEVADVAGKKTVLTLYSILLGVHRSTPTRLEVLAHPDEPWILLGRDVLNNYRLVLDGPYLALEIH